MAEGAASCIPMALRCVGDAIKLDSENKTKEAYCQYLSCIIYISQVLKDDAWDKDMKLVYNKDTSKLFRLLQQCQERAAAIVSSTSSTGPGTIHTEPSNVQQKLTGEERPQHPDGSTTTTQQLPHDQQYLHAVQASERKLSDSRAPQMTQDIPTAMQQQSWSLRLPSPPVSPQTVCSRSHGGKFGSLKKSYSDNQQLIVAYRMRMMNSNMSANSGTAPQKLDMSKSLSVLRKMSENMAIAQAREKALKKKIQERQQRVQEEANRRFGTSTLITKEEQEQRYIYTKILEFEQEMVWPKQLREQLKMNVDDSDLINGIISKIFSCTEHPLTQFLLQYQYHVYRKLSPLVKDVGFPDAETGRRAGRQESDGQRLEDDKHAEYTENTISFDKSGDEDNDGTEEDETAVEVEVEKPSGVIESDCDIDNTENNPEDQSPLGGTPSSEREINKDLNESGSPLAENNDEKDTLGETSVDLDTSTTDLSRSRNFLVDDSSPVENSANSETTEFGSGLEPLFSRKTEKCADDDFDFHELEADMLEWEDSDDEQCDSQNLLEEECKNSVEEKQEVQDIKTNENSGETSNPTFNVPPQMEFREANEGTNINSDDECGNAGGEATRDQSDEIREKLKDHEVNEGTNITSDECGNAGGEATRDQSDEIREKLKDHKANEGTNVTSDECGNAGGEATRDQSDEIREKLKDREANEGTNVTIDECGEVGGEPTRDHSDEIRMKLKETLVDIRFFLEKLQKMTLLAYEHLDTPLGRDQCYASLESPFFKPLWPMILAVLRRVNYEKEVQLANVMTEYIVLKPQDLGVRERLAMENQEVLIKTGNKYPYQLAVEELHKIVTYVCPLEKLEGLVRTSRAICQCVEDYWESMGKSRHSSESTIGCDDLLPILTFVIVKSGMAQLVSECNAMEEFIPEGYLMGEEGYCLTSLVTALAYLATLSK